ncbi:MAG: SprB repeat-containing protein [Lentimicrobiaceae bacterium]|nr:SprB repeat-containing protein [Lentimicrobiaceae bacterium]
MKTILSLKIRLRQVFLFLLLLIGTHTASGNNFTEQPCNYYNVFTLSATLTHNTAGCSKKNEDLPHFFTHYRAAIVSKKILDEAKSSPDIINFYMARLQSGSSSFLDLPLVDDFLVEVYYLDYMNVDIEDYYVIICTTQKKSGSSSNAPLYEDAATNLNQLLQSPIAVQPIGGSATFDYSNPVLIKLTDLLQNKLIANSSNPSCETVEFHLQSKCEFTINDTKTIYLGSPYYIALGAQASCNSNSFLATPNSYPAEMDFVYTSGIFRWEYTHSGLTGYKLLSRKGQNTRIIATESPDMPIGENIVVKVVDGREGNSKNSRVVCFYPDLPQPTNTGFQQIPEGQLQLPELKLKFNRSFNSDMEERPTVLTVYSSVGKAADGSPLPNESIVVYQEQMDTSKLDGLVYSTKGVSSSFISAGNYYVTVEGTVRGKSNHPDKNPSLPGEIKTAMFQIVPITVGTNSINIKNIEFIPPLCYGEKGKIKLTLGSYFLPGISKYPNFYYRTGEDPNGGFTYDTINFRCTYSGLPGDPQSTFECDHISSHQTHFKIEIPPLVQTKPSTGGILGETLSSNIATIASATDVYESQTAYFQIDFTQPDALDFPVEVKHNSGYYYVNRQMKMEDDGQITVFRNEASGGTPPYSFFFRDELTNLSDKPLTSDVLSAPNIGKRYITIKDSKGCSLTKTVPVGTLNGMLYVQLDTEREISCYNANDGILKATVVKKTENPLSYSWYKDGVLLQGKISPILYDLGPGTYKVVLTDTETGMASSDEIKLTQPSQLNLSVQQQEDVDCFGNRSGVLALKGSGGISPYLYLWDGVDYGSLRRDLPAGTYQVKLIDHNSCELTQSYTIQQPEKFEIIIDSVIHAHYGINGEYVPGRIALHSQGGTKPYKTLQSDAADLSKLDAGTYRFVQYDAKQCIDEKEVQVSFYEKMEIRIVQDRQNLCAGDKTAACHVEIVGGVPPFDIQWSNGKRQSSIEGLQAGSYEVRVTDAVGVVQSQSLLILTPDPLVIDSLSVKNPTYYGCIEDNCQPNGTDGKVNFAIRGGTAPYSQQWKKDGIAISEVLPDMPNLDAGKYELHITDNNGCEAYQTFNLADIPPLRVQIEVLQPIDCSGNNNGILQAKVLGGTPPYRYAWENIPDTLAEIGQLTSGTYKVSVTDALGVTASASLFLNEPEPLRILVDEVIPPSYPGSKDGIVFERMADGQIRVSAAGGSAAYRFEWRNKSDSLIGNQANLQGLSEGIYRLRLSDRAGCLADTLFELPRTEALLCSIGIEKPVSCFGFSDAALQAHIQGGKTPYRIQWIQNGIDSVGNGMLLEERACADYILLVTDSGGVEASFSLHLPQPDSLNLQLTAQNGLCAQDSGGFALASVQGGTLPYRYHWTVNGEESAEEDSLLSQLENATVELSVVDHRGCTAFASTTITAPKTLKLEYTAIDPSYSGSYWNKPVSDALDGSIELFAQGGTQPYRFFWNEVEEGSRKEGLDSGTYRISIQDANHCRLDTNIRLERTPNLLSRLDVLQNPLCADSLTGAFSLWLQGGVKPYTFDWYKDGKWISNDSVYLHSGMGAGVYKLILRDANGTISQDSLVISEPERISVSAQIHDASAWTIANGSIHVEVSGGIAPYELLWSNGSHQNDLHNLKRGSYTLNLYDANHCPAQNSYWVGSPDSLFISSLAIQNCRAEQNDGSIKLSIQGGLAPYRYHWKDAVGAIIHTDSGSEKRTELNSLRAGSYHFYLMDSGGAEIERLFEITTLLKLEAALLLENPIHCYGERTATIQAWIRGGKEPYNCTWYAISDSQQTHILPNDDPTRLENLPAGTYRLRVQDADGDTCSVQLTVGQAPALNLLADLYPADNLDTLDGYFILRPQGGRPPYTYRWSNGNRSSIQYFSRNETYAATVTDAEGCSAHINLDSVISQKLKISLHQTSDILCFGEKSGALRVDITNGKPPFSIRWSNGATSQENENLSAGLYTVWVRDAYGKSDSGSFLIRQPEELTNRIIVETPSCKGFSDGSISVSGTGGNGSYTYAWNTGDYTSSISHLLQGTYIVRTSDRLQCTRTDTIVLREPEKLLCELRIDSIFCPDEQGRIECFAQGGTAPYSYRWYLQHPRKTEVIKSGNEALIDPAEAGWYNLYLTDSKRCVFDTGIFLANPTPPSYQLENERSLCIGQTLSLKPEDCDTASNLQFLWFYPDGSASGNFEIQTDMTGLHKLIIIQNLRCLYRDSVNVTAFDDSIHAEFWVSSQITARQSCLLVNLSEYFPDSIAWHVPQNVNILSQDGNYLEIQFPTAGTYTVGMTSFKGSCSESTFRQVEVFDERQLFADNSSRTRLRWHIAPNPTLNNCRLYGESDRNLLVRYRLVRASTGHIVDYGTFSVEKGDKIDKSLFKGQEAAGMYILLLEYGNEKQSFKIVKL